MLAIPPENARIFQGPTLSVVFQPRSAHGDHPPTGELRLGREGAAAAVKRLLGHLGPLSFGRKPCVRLHDQRADLREQRTHGRTLPLERFDPAQSSQDLLGLVHGTDASGESRAGV